MMNLHNISIEKKIILLVSCGFVLSAIISAVYYLQIEKQQIERSLIKQSRTLFGQIVITRHWNAEHGGVYVYLKPEETVNPYLYKVWPGEGKKSTLEPEIQDQKGRRLALINPALMTRELSEQSKLYSDIRFHLTSLKLINPGNAPDLFEKTALEDFESGRKYKIQYSEIEGKPYFRYMEPLLIEKECLMCHGFQGYKVGDSRGGISISIPISEELATARQSRIFNLFIGSMSYLTIILILVWAIRQIIGRPIAELVKMASQVGTPGFRTPGSALQGDELGALSQTLIAADQKIRVQCHELELLLTEADEKSRIDALTRIHNRHHLYLEAPAMFAQAIRKHSPICTLMLDIDYFKMINDTYGHKAGDDVLIKLSTVIPSEIRSYDLFIRFGGEEFLIVLPDTSAQLGQQIAERIRNRLENSAVKLDNGSPVNFTVSIGLFCSVSQMLEQAIFRADENLYKAKEAGRNRVCISEEQSPSKSS
jgi:diguanylate cyclase (GGDEF)-like protein